MIQVFFLYTILINVLIPSTLLELTIKSVTERSISELKSLGLNQVNY